MEFTMRQLTSCLILFSILFVGIGCGNGETEEPAAQQAMDDGVRTIEIFGTDDMNFVVTEDAGGITTGDPVGQDFVLEEIIAEPGEEISIRLTTRSQLPATAMSHNFILLEMGMDPDNFSRMSLTAADNDYIAPDLEDRVIAATSLLGGGESDTITFTVPDEPGEYDFLCSFPGHYSGGMTGKLIVQ